MYSLRRIVEPQNPAVSLARAKSHLRILDSLDDGELNDHWIPAATKTIELGTDRQLITATWRLGLDTWPPDRLLLPKGRLQSVDEVSYLDQYGYRVVLDDDDFLVADDHEPAFLLPNYGRRWPHDILRAPGSVRVEYVCGFGDSESDIPQDLQQAILLQLSHMWGPGREGIVVGTSAQEIPRTIGYMLKTWELGDFFHGYQ